MILFATTLALAQQLSRSPVDFGAVPDDGIDDASAFAATIADLATWHEAVPEGEPVLTVPPGVWNLTNVGSSEYSLLITKTLRIACAPGAILVGDEESTASAKRLLNIKAVGQDLEGFVIDNCVFRHARPWSVGEQAHTIIISGEEGYWVRGIALKNLTFDVVGSGDAVYCASRCEGFSAERILAYDVARNVFTIGGGADVLNERRGYYIGDVRASWRGHNPEQENGNVIDFEANDLAIRIFDVHVQRIRAPKASVDLGQLVGGVFDGMDISKLTMGRMDGAVFRDLWMDCGPGDGGDAAGYCIVHKRPPSVFTITGLLARVHPDGQGVLSVRDYTRVQNIPDHEKVYGVRVEGRAILDGAGHITHPGTYDDPLRLNLNLEIVQ